MGLTKREMPETMYRASRCCRVLGNPTAYLVIRCLGGERKTPSELCKLLRVPVPTISITLRHLRQVDLVRYEAKGKTKNYWLKDQKILDVLDSFEDWVEAMRKRQT